jgi:hypothetical protein
MAITQLKTDMSLKKCTSFNQLYTIMKFQGDPSNTLWIIPEKKMNRWYWVCEQYADYPLYTRYSKEMCFF